MSDDKAARLIELAGVLPGLVTQIKRRQELTRYAWPLSDNPSADASIPPAHCWRSVSQRTLSHPIAWLGDFTVDDGVNIYQNVLDGLELPYLPLTDPTTTDPDQIVNFYDNDAPSERGGIAGMVLIGLRARMVVANCGLRTDPSVKTHEENAWTTAVPAFARHYLAFRLTHVADRRTPWVSDTLWAYMDRPSRAFVTVPPLIWNRRNTRAELVNRAPDFGGTPPGTPGPTLGLSQPVVPHQGSASVLIEGLFVPDPDRCPNIWPGLWCPPQAIRGHQKFDPDYYAARRAKIDLAQRALRPQK